MNKTMKINIVSSSEEIYSGEATMVFATGTLGELGIAPGHTPLPVSYTHLTLPTTFGV